MTNKRRKFVAIGASLVVSAMLLEVGGAVVYWRIHGEAFCRAAVLARLDESAADRAPGFPVPVVNRPSHVSNKILHPYLGFVFAPFDPRVNRFGFFGPDPLLSRSAGVVNVVIMGGSVALGFSGQGAQPLAETLRSVPGLRGKNIVVTSLAIDGYKQPQQLLALSWLLSIGARFDILVNLDGFNEIALPFAENYPAGVSISFPRAWDLYVAQSFQPETAVEVAKIVRLRAERSRLRRLFRHWPLRASVFCLTLWDGLDRAKDAQVKAEDVILRGLLQGSNANPAVLGPVEPGLDEDGVFEEAVRVWSDASLQMATLCRANGIEYFHFLQPNQYVAGSKTLNEEEKRTAYSEGTRFGEAVERAYPRLRAEGRELRNKGVAFFDLTQIFTGETGTIYIDDCCHVNLEGNRIMAQEIGRRIGEVLRTEESSPGTGS